MIAIVDYGAGNVFNVVKAFDYLGVESKLTADKADLLSSEAIVLPGVGAFKMAMENLAEKKLIEPIKQAAATGIPLLGICLGMQMLFDSSDEFGHTKGLGLIPGKVIRFPNDLGLIIPQVGWNQNKLLKKESIFKDIDGQYTYFVHSYYVNTSRDYQVTTVDYGVKVPGIVQNKNVYGMQFHPEKSSQVGLDLLKTFVEKAVVK